MLSIRATTASIAVLFALVFAAPAHAGTDVQYIKEEVEVGQWLKPTHRPYFKKLYGDRTFTPIWTTDGYLNERAIELRNAVMAVVPSHGLQIKDYWTAQIESFFQPSYDVRSWLAAEMVLSKVFLDVSMHLNVGRIAPSSVSTDIKYTQRSFTEWPELQNALNGAGIAATWDRLAPQHEGYMRLKLALARLHEMERNGGFKAIFAPPQTLKVGVSAPVVRSIKERARAMGYFVSSIDTNYDAELQAIVEDIQEWNLANPIVKGQLSPKDNMSWEYFSISSARRIQQTEINMEKYRWLPREMERKYIFVNLATQRLKLIDPDNTMDSVREMKTINGRPTRKTPSMRDETKMVVLNPTWGVPPRIFAEDKLTHIRELLGKGGMPAVAKWMEQSRFHVMDDTLTKRLPLESIDWANLEPKEKNGFYIVQQPGYMNALGVAKIMLGNPWFIYMHDTNERHLFKESWNRAVSSGCIRLERPLDMVEYLLRSSKWQRPQIDAFVAKPGETKDKETWVRIPDQNRIPLYTMSLTAQVGDDNIIRFTQDVYGQNLQILKTMQASGFYRP